MSKLKIAATGLGGLVGSRIKEILNNDFTFIPLTHDIIDIVNTTNVNTVLKDIDFDIFLHLAGYTNVDLAETEDRALAHDLNVIGTKNLFNAVQEKKKKFIYISTGFVFDGMAPPFYEENRPNPISYYGQTKYEGEQIVIQNGMIVRIEYPYREHFLKKNDFVRTIKMLLEKGQPITAIEDSLITPTYIDDIAHALKYLMNNYSPEIYHLVGANSLSPYEAAIQISTVFNLDESLITKTSYDQYFNNKAKRPQFAEVKSKKNTFFPMKSFEEGLEEINKSF